MVIFPALDLTVSIYSLARVRYRYSLHDTVGALLLVGYLRGYVYVYICREASKDTPILYKGILSLAQIEWH
jgi:hypothetical protein